jgi:hypothetical protein
VINIFLYFIGNNTYFFKHVIKQGYEIFLYYKEIYTQYSSSEKDHFTIKPYRSLEKETQWQIIIEGLENKITSVPQFLNKEDWRRGIKWFDGLEENL